MSQSKQQPVAVLPNTYTIPVNRIFIITSVTAIFIHSVIKLENLFSLVHFAPVESCLLEFFSQAAFDKAGKGIDRFFFIGAVGGKFNFYAFSNSQREDKSD